MGEALDSALRDFDILLDVFVRMADSRAEVAIPLGEAWQNDAQLLALKLFRHLTSLKIVCRPTSFGINENLHSSFIDHSSAKVIARAVLETYLVFSYIYNCPLSTGFFRHETWVLGGLLDRQKLKARSKEAQEKLLLEKERIEILRGQIKGNSEWRSYNQEQQKKLLKGEWRAGKSWNALAEMAGFNHTYVSQVYSYLCGYSHCSYISVLQIGQAARVEDQEMLSHTSLDIANSVLGHFIPSYPKIFPPAGAILAEDLEGKACAEIWHYRSATEPSPYRQRSEDQ